MAKPRIITLLTDFGRSDSYVAQMKAVMLTVAPDATLVDVTHDVPPGDVLAGAFALASALPHFPAGTVHCVVIDPTVGTDRRILAARYAGQTVVAPDNGVITLVDRVLPLEQIAAVRDRRYFRGPSVSATFHGRDIFAPVAAHLARGLVLDRLGPQPETVKFLEVPEPRVRADGTMAGQVLYVDRFGNLISNIPADSVAEAIGGGSDVGCGGRPVGPIRRAYADVERGEALALVNSMGLIEVAVNGGRAADVLGAGVGTEVRVGAVGGGLSP